MEDGWVQTYRGIVHAWMCDHFGHVNVRFYAHLFDDAGFALWPLCGVSTDEFTRLGVHTVVARTETDLQRELLAGQVVQVRSRWTEMGTKSVCYEQQLTSTETGVMHAAQRVVEVFFDPTTRTSCAIPDSIRAILAKRLGKAT